MTVPTLTQITPRPVVDAIEHLHRDLSVARDARDGLFTHAGVALQLGTRPDWLTAGLARDEEWRIEWVKCYEGLDLAHACSVTGDLGFLRAWEDLVETFCDQIPVGHDSSDVSARRLQNWLYAWQRFAAGPGYRGLRGGLAARLIQRIDADAQHLVEHLTTERNHRTLELYAVLLVGLAVDEGPGRAEYALHELATNASLDIWDDGVHRECSTDYHLIVLRSLLGAIANARQAGLPIRPELVERTRLACDFALHVQRPDGLTPALSDGDPGDYRSLLALAADLLDRPDLRWAATCGVLGSPPDKRLAGFPVGGYHVHRSGWGEGRRAYADERWCVVDCGPLGDGGHGHYDQLSVEIVADGLALVVDPGRYTYADDDDGWRRWFKGTAAHNTVCVDGADQTPYRPGKPKGATSTARLVERWSEPGLDVICGEVRSPSYDAVHVRTVAFVDDEYWIIHDRLRAGGPHDYAARWHLAPGAWRRSEIETSADQTIVRVPQMWMVVPRGGGDVHVEDGWVSPSYGVKQRAPIVVVSADGRPDADLLTVISPGGSTAVSASAVIGTDRVQVRVNRAGRGTDTVWWAFDAGAAGWERGPC